MEMSPSWLRHDVSRVAQTSAAMEACDALDGSTAALQIVSISVISRNALVR